MSDEATTPAQMIHEPAAAIVIAPFRTHKQLRMTWQTGKLDDAKAKAQAEFLPIARDKIAEIRSQKGNYDYWYADLAAVIEAVTPSLTKYGLALYTPISEQDFKAMEVTATIRLAHGESGQWMECDYRAAIAENIDPRKVGSATTYARRYGALAMLGINPHDEDDDGDAAEPRNAARGFERPQQPQDDHPNAPRQQESRKPAASPRTSTQTEAPAAATEQPASVPFETAPAVSGGEDAFFALLLGQLDVLGLKTLPTFTVDDLLEEWARRLQGFEGKADLNKFGGPCISKAKEIGRKSALCDKVAASMAKAFTARTNEMTQAARK